CFVPMAAAYAIVSGGGTNTVPPERGTDIARVAALAAWRMTRGIYRFDRTLFNHLIETPIEGKIPIEVLYRLPEWCVYIETPGLILLGEEMAGFFAHLEWVPDLQVEELRLLANLSSSLYPVALHLTGGDLVSALDASLAESNAQLRRLGYSPIKMQTDHISMWAASIAPMLSLVLYLCTVNSELRDSRGTDRQPSNPGLKKTKHGRKLFAAQGPTEWEAGYRLGAALRAAEREDSTPAVGSHKSPRPHVRRAHWHAYWTGPLDGERKITLKWLSPILVGVDDVDSLPGVIRDVEE
ncbi:MAG: hypothetical protein AB1631_34625, partial [Acidobacteriota bacterium]